MKLFIGTLAVCFAVASSAFSQGPSDTIDYETARLSRIAAAVRATEKTTMIYTHVLNRGGRGVRSPADNSNAEPNPGWN